MTIWNKNCGTIGFAVVCLSMAQVVALKLQLPPGQDSFTASHTRRRFVEGAVLAGSSWLLPNQDAHAAKGAAEYDLEYYMRDLLGGNAREGNVMPSKAPPVAPPRTLNGPLLPLLLNDDCSSTCIPTQVLLQQLKNYDESLVTKRVKDYREKVSRSFAARAPWKEEHVTDQYYFDLTSYALWRTAAELLPDYIQRDIFARNVGRGIYREACKTGLLSRTVSKGSKLTATIPASQEILNLFQSSQYCRSFRLGESDKTTFFDSLDDDDLALGATVNCLMSVFEPSSLGASLQITGEQSRFIPEFVGATLGAMWEAAGVKASYETYFVDPEYRPNPKDYFPNEQLLQFSLVSM
jgi:hypothetical protein